MNRRERWLLRASFLVVYDGSVIVVQSVRMERGQGRLCNPHKRSLSAAFKRSPGDEDGEEYEDDVSDDVAMTVETDEGGSGTANNVIWPVYTELTANFLEDEIFIDPAYAEGALEKLRSFEIDTVGTLCAVYKSVEEVEADGLSTGSAHAIWRFIQKQNELSRMNPVPLRLRFTRPNVLRDGNDGTNFIPTSEYQEIYRVLQNMTQWNYPSSQSYYFVVCIVQGAKGVGKTITTWRAALSVPNIVPCYLRLDDFLESTAIEPTLGSREILASLLAYVFSNSQIKRFDLDLREVISKIRTDLALKEKKLVLHIDDFHINLAIARKIVFGCIDTLSSDFGIARIPIVSGDYCDIYSSFVDSKGTMWIENVVEIPSRPEKQREGRGTLTSGDGPDNIEG